MLRRRQQDRHWPNQSYHKKKVRWDRQYCHQHILRSCCRAEHAQVLRWFLPRYLHNLDPYEELQERLERQNQHHGEALWMLYHVDFPHVATLRWKENGPISWRYWVRWSLMTQRILIWTRAMTRTKTCTTPTTIVTTIGMRVTIDPGALYHTLHSSYHVLFLCIFMLTTYVH